MRGSLSLIKVSSARARKSVLGNFALAGDVFSPTLVSIKIRRHGDRLSLCGSLSGLPPCLGGEGESGQRTITTPRRSDPPPTVMASRSAA